MHVYEAARRHGNAKMAGCVLPCSLTTAAPRSGQPVLFFETSVRVTPADGRAQLRSFFVRCRREAEAQAQSRSA